jgi:GBP family porin
LFNRQAWVGLTDANLGKITFGYNYAPIVDVVADYDPVHYSTLYSPLGFSSTLGGGGGIAEDTRVENSIRYTDKINGVNFGFLYKLGGVGGSTSARSAYGLNLGYEAGPFGIQGAYQHFVDGYSGSQSVTPGAVNVTVENSTAYFLAAKYKIADATIKAGWERYSIQAASDYNTIATIGGGYYGYALGAGTNSYGWTAGATNGAPDKVTNVYFIGGDYDFTPALNLAAGYYAIVNSSIGANALGAGATASSNVDAFSILLDYRLSKRTDVYAGAMFLGYGGLYNTPVYNSSNNIIGFGLRHKF